MTADVDICNRALSMLGTAATTSGGLVSSLTENSVEAQQCNLHYAATRDELLSAYPWNFARRQVTLAPLPIAPPSPWGYVYAYPAACLKLRFLLPVDVSLPAMWQRGPLPVVPYIITGVDDAQGNPSVVIATNLATAAAVYTGRVVIPDAWDNSFQAALVAALAAKLALPLTGSGPLAQGMKQAAKEAWDAATCANANEGIPMQSPTPHWLAVRGIDGDGADDLTRSF